tara:strand:- start:296 stop:706 length:411 start_codon:yes stop_codon:yes gene_type:complete
MNKLLIVKTSWYEDHISKMFEISKEILGKEFKCLDAVAPGALELSALASHKISISDDKYKGIIFLGIVIRGETSHYDLVTQEVFRSIGVLSNNHSDIAIINNVICVENIEQLEARLVKNTTNNSNALIELVNEKSS